ncbi:hypothetical protein FEK35_27155 [Nocardia cyriacigeorgica]|uniref:Uncharacterized protein n=1 Tax=Nocardia cyriacigeorgica TaxID=135487 RepID=A0A5R8P6Y5_9NOCA|nr:hypothetical protein [Nocardia cyriacigeorgica]TLF96772.1 hypothetical protein FEK35_27155 [Nocardia cyriacigeorgica]
MSDTLARTIWACLCCDPDDPAADTVWPQLPAEVRARYESTAELLRKQLAQPSPTQWTPRHFRSAAEVPDGCRFRPVGEDCEYIRVQAHARAAVPANNAVRYSIDTLDGRYARGYVEVTI